MNGWSSGFVWHMSTLFLTILQPYSTALGKKVQSSCDDQVRHKGRKPKNMKWDKQGIT
jgi:hypothetical protein